MTDMTFARTRLETTLRDGLRSAGPVIESILSTRPVDEVLPAKRTGVRVEHGYPAVELVDAEREGPSRRVPSRVRYALRDETFDVSSYAFGQVMQRAGMPVAYGRSLLDGDPEASWKGSLLEHSLAQHLANQPGQVLVRRVDEQVRGVLSDRFKRMDSRPMLDAFIGACKNVGAQPISGHATETRHAVRVVIPKIYEPVPGEALAFGLHWGNSDFGNGTYHVTAFCLRLWCLNGMVGEKELKKTHVGAQLQEGIQYSNRTYQLSEQALASQTTDVVKAVLGDDFIEERCSAIRAMHETETDFKTAWAKVGKQLSKTERGLVEAAFTSNDELNVPAGKTMWRFVNALSWVANREDVSEERRLDLQAVAGKLT